MLFSLCNLPSKFLLSLVFAVRFASPVFLCILSDSRRLHQFIESMFMQLSLRRFVSFSFYFRWKSRLNLLRVIDRLFYFRFRVRIVLRRPQMRRLPGQDLSRDLVNSTRRLAELRRLRPSGESRPGDSPRPFMSCSYK